MKRHGCVLWIDGARVAAATTWAHSCSCTRNLLAIAPGARGERVLFVPTSSRIPVSTRAAGGRIRARMSPMTHNPDGSDAELQVLPADECYRLLGTHEIGRIGATAEHYPLIIPVNYALDGTTVVIRTHPGTVLRAATHGNVTFEVDDIDRRTRSGWNVLVRASAEEVGERHRAELIERTRATGVQPWAPGEHGSWLRLIPHHISGRRIVPGELPA